MSCYGCRKGHGVQLMVEEWNGTAQPTVNMKIQTLDQPTNTLIETVSTQANKQYKK